MRKKDTAPLQELGQKFACLALSERRSPPVSSLDLGGRSISRSFPREALSTWKDDIGRFHQEELANSELFLWAAQQSSAPAILDHEKKTFHR